jgi:hypothetical protein
MPEAAARAPTEAELLERLRELNAEAAGIWQLQILGLGELPDLMLAALEGDRDAKRKLMLSDMARRGMPPCAVCLLCPHVFGEETPAALVLLSALRPDATMMLTNGLCAMCAAAPDRAERVTGYYRKKLFGEDMRIISVGDVAGHA